MPTYTPLGEWCDANAHRQFPLTDEASGRDLTSTFQLPQPFLVDLLLCVPPGFDLDKFFLMTVLVRLGSIDVHIGYDDGAVPFEVASVLGIPMEAGRNSVHYLSAYPQTDPTRTIFKLTTGALVVGSTDQIKAFPGLWQFDPTSAYFIASRVTEGLAAVHSLQVGTAVLTGNIVLKEGTNVTLSPSYDVGTDVTTITISATPDTGGGTEEKITDNDSLIEALLRRFGQPVTSLSGVDPDAEGNIQLAGTDCMQLTSPAASVLSIYNPCSLPCCGKEELTNVYQVMSDLNLRYARMESYYESISRNVNTMQALLVGLEL